MKYGTIALLLSSATAFHLPDWQSFLPALPAAFQDYLPILSSNSSAPESHDLLRRQSSSGCPANFNSCANLGAANLCCAPQAVCSADAAGHVACCPVGYACSGTISGVITAGTLNSQGSLVGGATAGGGLVTASTTASTTAFQNPAMTTTTTTNQNGNNGNGNGGIIQTGNGGFIVDGTSTVATPAAAVHAANIPLIARGILRLLEFLPL